LPAAGRRYRTSVSGVGYNGNYWSFTPIIEHNAYYMNFYSYNLFATNNHDRYFGFSVRPVR
jgi:hypothetical protein